MHLRALTRDESVKHQRVAPGTWRRVLRFAAPYRRLLALFLVLIVADAVVGVANPLLYRMIINRGILRRDVGLVVGVAAVVAGLALLDAAFGVAQRYLSARIGEGLIFDLRSQVFAHLQKMPLAFFTRAQTGALVSRLNNDVLGAQQAFTDTFSNVIGNFVGVALVVAAMLVLSWPITLAALALLPLFILPARLVGRRLQKITREAYGLNAEMTSMMTERFNVAGALLVKLFGRPGRERADFDRRAGRVRDIGVVQAMYGRLFFAALMLTASLATALVYGWGGTLAIRGALNVGTVVALVAYLNRLYGPLTQLSNVQVDVMTALVSFERVFEVLDLEPMIAERPGARELAPGPARASTRRLRLPGGPGGLARLARVGRRPRALAAHPGPPRRLLHRRARLDGRPRRADRCGQDDDRLPRRSPVRGGPGSGPPERGGRARPHALLGASRRRPRHPGRPPPPRHDPGEPALRQAGRDRGGAARRAARRPGARARGLAARRARHLGRRPRLPALGRGEAARRDRPAAAQVTRRRRARRGDGTPRLRVRGRRPARARRGPRRPHLARHRAPPLDGARRRRDPRPRRRAHRRARSPRRAPRARWPVRRPVPDAVRRAARRAGATVRRRAARRPGAA